MQASSFFSLLRQSMFNGPRALHRVAKDDTASLVFCCMGSKLLNKHLQWLHLVIVGKLNELML
jgi:hypothetical protein